MKRSARVRAFVDGAPDHIQLVGLLSRRLQVHVHVHLRRSRRRPSTTRSRAGSPHALAAHIHFGAGPVHGRDDTSRPSAPSTTRAPMVTGTRRPSRNGRCVRGLQYSRGYGVERGRGLRACSASGSGIHAALAASSASACVFCFSFAMTPSICLRPSRTCAPTREPAACATIPRVAPASAPAPAAASRRSPEHRVARARRRCLPRPGCLSDSRQMLRHWPRAPSGSARSRNHRRLAARERDALAIAETRLRERSRRWRNARNRRAAAGSRVGRTGARRAQGRSKASLRS